MPGGEGQEGLAGSWDWEHLDAPPPPSPLLIVNGDWFYVAASASSSPSSSCFKEIRKFWDTFLFIFYGTLGTNWSNKSSLIRREHRAVLRVAACPFLELISSCHVIHGESAPLKGTLGMVRGAVNVSLKVSTLIFLKKHFF